MSEINLATRGYVDATVPAAVEAALPDAVDTALASMLDAIYPIGSICLGTHPTIGTWEVFDFGGVIYSDSSLAAGTAMTESLPNVYGKFGIVSGAGYTPSGVISRTTDGTFIYSGAGTNFQYGWSTLDASQGDTTYGATAQPGYKVQVKGTNITAWKRTA